MMGTESYDMLNIYDRDGNVYHGARTITGKEVRVNFHSRGLSTDGPMTNQLSLLARGAGGLGVHPLTICW